MSDRDGAAIDTTEDIDALLEAVRAITVVGNRASLYANGGDVLSDRDELTWRRAVDNTGWSWRASSGPSASVRSESEGARGPLTRSWNTRSGGLPSPGGVAVAGQAPPLVA
jgi:hypothetical protein